MPPSDGPEERLTPEAARVISELLTDIRRKTLIDAERRSYGAEISVRDVVESFQFQTAADRAFKLIHRWRRMIRSISIAALILIWLNLFVTIGATLLQYGFQAPIPATLGVPIGLSAALAGAFTSLTYFLIRTTSSQVAELGSYSAGEVHSAGAFLEVWIRLESLVRTGIASYLGASVSEKSMSALLSELVRTELLTIAEAKDLRELVDFRNRVVHTSEFDDFEVRKWIGVARNLTRLLEQRFSR